MTDRMAALTVLCDHDTPAREQALQVGGAGGGKGVPELVPSVTQLTPASAKPAVPIYGICLVAVASSARGDPVGHTSNHD
jgi:hypothetical protein